MKCIHCGAELESGLKQCPYCDASIEIVKKEEVVVQQAVIDKPEVVEKVEESDTVNETEKDESVFGKTYAFISAVGANFWGIFNNRIQNDVELTDDRLLITTTPKRFNSAPGVMFEDIIDISITRKYTFYAKCYIVLSIILAFIMVSLGLISLAIWLFCGRHSVIKISQRNGKTITLYSRDKEEVEMFKEDMKKVSKIR